MAFGGCRLLASVALRGSGHSLRGFLDAVQIGHELAEPALQRILGRVAEAKLEMTSWPDLVVHTIVTGGQALLDTLHGAAQLVKQLDAARFVIWLNPFWGPVADNGRTFEPMNLYEAIKKRIETIVSLPAFTDELFPQDIASMLKSRLTFKEAIESPDHSLMSRHRLKVAQREFYSRLDSLAV
jgi:hypothetical protein